MMRQLRCVKFVRKTNCTNVEPVVLLVFKPSLFTALSRGVKKILVGKSLVRFQFFVEMWILCCKCSSSSIRNGY